jgi:hypothetical protein
MPFNQLAGLGTQLQLWEEFMRACFLISSLCLTGIFYTAAAHAQQSIALRNGESTELGTVWWVANCETIMVGMPDVEIMEGPPELSLSIKEAMVVPRRVRCTNRVPGGILMATAKDVTHRVQGKLVYRIKYKTKDGDRELSNTYDVSLYP